MFDKLNNPREVFGHKLGSALTMEQKVLEMLGDLEYESQRDELKRQFSHHADETRQQIANIEQAFRAMGEEPDDSPCPAMKGLEADAKANIKMADDSVVDDVILGAAAATQNHEQEQHTLNEVTRAQRQIVHQAVTAA